MEPTRSTQEVAARYQELALQEKWIQIQEELFADEVRSIEPAHSPYFRNAEGKEAVKKKAGEWMQRIEAVHGVHTTQPVVGGNHFAVGRAVDMTVRDMGRIHLNELIVYEVCNGKIILEQFLY